ncbi:ribosomal protein L6 [Caulochytrium protostelioides]|nr:ribosomal protein L6 [Caulochytrium protostelioides]
MWGTTRTLIANMVRGLTEEFTVLVHFEGVGYRAALAPVPTAPDYPGQQQLVMRLGYCNDMIERVPFGVSVRIPSAQRLVLQGPDLQVVTQLAAKIRAHRPPEPYNQKGVFVGDETIAKKEGKR